MKGSYKTLATGLVSALLLLLTSCMLMPKQDRAEDRLPAVLMQRSGLNAQLQQVPRILQAALARERAYDPEVEELPQSRFDELHRVMGIAFDPATLKASVQQRLSAELPMSDMQEVLNWLESPLGRTVTVLEEQASRPETYEARQGMFSSVQPGADRMLRFRKLDAAVKGTDSALNAALAAQTAVITALSADIPRERRPSVDEILQLLRKLSPGWQETAERQTVLSFVDIYRSISDSELDRYIAFAVSPAGEKYHRVILDAVFEALLQGSRRLEHALEKSESTVRNRGD